MYFIALAVDYDGTIASNGAVDEDTIDALESARRSGRRLILVTGRELPDLRQAFDRLDIFDMIVAENGAVLLDPSTGETTALAPAADESLVRRLDEAGVRPLSVGHSIIATWRPNETKVLAFVHELGLEQQIIFNKGAVMVLPPGVNKASGLKAALEKLALSRHNVVGIGDAENDHAFLMSCGLSVAVANALPSVKEGVDLVTRSVAGRGVAELVNLLIATDLEGAPTAIELKRHHPRLGQSADGDDIHLSRASLPVLIIGESGGGKSTAVQAIIERVLEEEFQCCIIDPEGDFAQIEGVVSVGGPKEKPSDDVVRSMLARPDVSVAVNLLAIDINDRPAYFAALLAQVMARKVETGRPHWLIVDEAHHVLPAGETGLALPPELPASIFVTVDPGQLPRSMLDRMGCVIGVGEGAARAIAKFCAATERQPPAGSPVPLEQEQALLWMPDRAPTVVRIEPPKGVRRRHVRKYAEGELGDDKSFYFRGPEGKLNLKAQNLVLFQQLADGIDDDTWLHHLRAGDYSRWIATAIKDADLAQEVQVVENDRTLSPRDSRAGICRMIGHRYTAPARK